MSLFHSRPLATLTGGPGVDEGTAFLLADPQTSGGLLVAGEVDGATIIGELVPRTTHLLALQR